MEVLFQRYKSPGQYLIILTRKLFCGSRTDLVPAYVRLLQDNEAEVRIAAAGKVTKFCQLLNPELSIQHILPCVKVRTFTRLLLFLNSI